MIKNATCGLYLPYHIIKRLQNKLNPPPWHMKKARLKKLLQNITDSKDRHVLILTVVKLGLKDRPITEKTDKAHKIIRLMTGNPNFISPIPSLAHIDTLTTALELAQQAMDGSKRLTFQRDMALKAFTTGITALQGYVQAASGGIAEKILSSGFDVRNARSKTQILPAPQELSAQAGTMDGEIKLKWKLLKGTTAYIVMAKPDNDPSAEWKQVAITSKRTTTISKLEPGQKYLLCVIAMNTAGKSAHSVEIACRARHN
jgi:hypothetical protein